MVERSSNDVYAVNLADGSLLWEVSLRLPSALIAQIVRAGADQLYVATTDGDVVALDTRNGELRWSAIVESSTPGSRSRRPARCSWSKPVRW